MCGPIIHQHVPRKMSLYILSCVWLLLCGSLVQKHRDLLAVFFSFLGSFVAAAVLSPSTLLARNKLNPEYIENNKKTKHLVGLLACLAALYGISTSASLLDGSHHHSPTYLALSLVAGYLAFEHWFSALFCQPPPKPLMAITEDALSLSAILVALVVVPDLETYQNYISSWLAYKAVRLITSLSTPSANSDSSVPESTTTVEPTPLWTIHGQQYDLTDYVDRHPGGKEALRLGQGRDCTALFESYHPFTAQHRRVLAKYRTRKQKPLPTKDHFYDILSQRVTKALREKHHIDPIEDRAATWQRTLYYWTIAAALCASGYYHCRGSFIGSIFFAVFGWLIGALGHDAGHFSASRRPFVNDLGVWAMALLCNPIMWQHQHTYAHHSFTNSLDHDPDVHHFTTLLRVHRRFLQQDIYRYQRHPMYVFFAYAFVVFGTCLWIPLYLLRDGSLYGVVEWTDRQRPLRAAGMVAHLLTYALVVAILPFLTHTNKWSALASVVVHLATSGLLFGIFSQINHINEASMDETALAEREALRKGTKLENSWAIAQIETSNNFATGSSLWHVLSNGLNLQVEHHLFPGLNHCHLHLVADTVREMCLEYGVEYKCYDSWSSVMGATLSWLDRLALEGSE